MRTVLMTLLILCCLSSPAFTQTVASVSGDRVTLNLGSAKGVKVGMEAFILVTEEIDGELIELEYAQIRIVSVSRNSSVAKIVYVGAGWELKKGLKVRFNDKLVSLSSGDKQPKQLDTPEVNLEVFRKWSAWQKSFQEKINELKELEKERYLSADAKAKAMAQVLHAYKNPCLGSLDVVFRHYYD